MRYVQVAKTFYIVCSVLLCVIGILLICMPSVTASLLCIVLGVISLVYGVEKILGYFSRDMYRLAFQFDLALGILVAILGIILLFRPGHVLAIVDFIVGLFVLMEGVFKVQTSVEAQRFGLRGWWMILVGALLTVVMGLILIIGLFSGTSVVMIFVGVSLLIDGIQNLFNALYTIKVIHRTPYDGKIVLKSSEWTEEK